MQHARVTAFRGAIGLVIVALLIGIVRDERGRAAQQAVAAPGATAPHGVRFATSHECTACHNGLTTPTGEDVSIGVAWRASMMANSSRDPYWHAAVRREVMDHPSAGAEIEHECSRCHMPMARTSAEAEGRRGQVFAHLPFTAKRSERDTLAADGVSCTVCHQIGPDRLGTAESFTGGFVIAPPGPDGNPRLFGPYEVNGGHTTLMRSATAMVPTEGKHLRDSEVCATCHTLYTHALGPNGNVIGELPEQVPYLEWRHSAFREERSCGACHMPEARGALRITSVLGEDRPSLGRHTFLGGNFFMLRMLNRYRNELGVEALPHELEAAAAATIAQLQRDTATVSVLPAGTTPGQVAFDVDVRNVTGHKLPTGYPSRRAWLHVVVRDADGAPIFTSGAIEPSGRIRGNDNDDDPRRFEPHYAEIRREDEVQIYESIMHDADQAVTTGLLRGTGYLKDNRLLPRGFDKATAPRDVAVIGDARNDPAFSAEGHRLRYVVPTGGRRGPFRVDVELRYQPTGYRWAQNLSAYDAPETRRFVAWYDAMAAGSSVALAHATSSVQ